MTARRRGLRRLADRAWLVTAGHVGWPVPLVAAVVMRFMPSLWAVLVWVPVLLAGLVLLAAHAAGICPRCAPGMVPTLPTREVARWRPVLGWLHHWPYRWETWVLLGVHLAVTYGWGGAYARWSVVTVAVAFAAGMLALRTHARLRPWCPWCIGRGPDDDPPQGPATPPGGLARRPRVPAVPDDPALCLTRHGPGRAA